MGMGMEMESNPNPSQSAARARPANTKLSGKMFLLCGFFVLFLNILLSRLSPLLHRHRHTCQEPLAGAVSLPMTSTPASKNQKIKKTQKSQSQLDC